MLAFDQANHALSACTHRDCPGAVPNPEYLQYSAENGNFTAVGTPPEKWLLPKIHNSPACLSGRKPGFPMQ
eukprot:COSAG02_NODE_2967_length_7641_cov_10.730708_3_plen_71_part_00